MLFDNLLPRHLVSTSFSFCHVLRSLSLLGGPSSSVGPAGSVLAAVHRDSALRLLPELEGVEHTGACPRAEVHVQGYRGPLQVGSQH